MYFDYMINWIYRTMQLPVPIVTAPNVYGLVTIFDIFMFTVYIAVFIILIRYIITDELSFKVGSPEDISYNSDMYMAKQFREDSTRFAEKLKERKANRIAKQQFYLNLKNKPKTYVNTVYGRIMAKRKAGRIETNSDFVKAKINTYKFRIAEQNRKEKNKIMAKRGDK